MRPTGIPHRPILVSAWHRKPNTRIAVLQRIEAVTRELEAIQSEMHSHLTGPVAGKPSGFFEDGAAVQVVHNFKAELDQLRRILWFYIEEAAGKPLPGTEQKQARQTLTPQPTGPYPGQQSASFFDRLNVVIDTYMQEKKPAAAEAKFPSRTDSKASL